MDIKLRNEISDLTAEHIRKVGIDEVIEQFLLDLDALNGARRLIASDKTDTKEHLARRRLITEVRMDFLTGCLAHLTGKYVYEINGSLVFCDEPKIETINCTKENK